MMGRAAPACGAALLFAAVACSDVFGPGAEPFCASAADTVVVSFPDSALDVAVRAELSVSPQLPLTCGMVAQVTALNAAGAGIASLEGIENLSGLTTLWIRANEITDIASLRGLTQLTSLNLAANQIADVSPLRHLTELTFLAINENGAIADVEPLAGLTKLTGTLWLGGNAITDLSPLGALTGLAAIRAPENELTDLDGIETLMGLSTISVDENRLTDVSALAGLPSLVFVGLRGNPDLADVQALIDNPDLGAAAIVNLSATGVACADVDALRAKGVSMISDCP